MPDYGVGSWPARRARISPDTIAFRQGGRAVTYQALARDVGRLASAFAERGVTRGARVAYLGPNDITAFEVFFAAARLGALFVPFNTRLAAPEIAYLIEDSKPGLIVDGTGSGFPGALSLVDCERLTSARAAPEAEIALEDDAVILYTSGTTGRPKGAVLTHANLTFNTMNQLAHTDVLSTDTALCIAPLFHATGLGQVSLPTLFKGGTVVVQPKFDAAEVLAAIARHRVTSFSAVPAMLQILAAHADFDTTDLSSLRYVIYGGSSIPEHVAVTWQRRGVALQQGYGMTEASPGVYLAPIEGAADRPTSVGVPHFFTDVTFDAAEPRPVPGTRGELLVRGLNVFRGYWERPEATEQAFTAGWYRSGDVVEVAGDGWAYVVDRVRDLIISGGENIYPAEVEAALHALAGVDDCAVVGVPDPRWGEVGHAHVVAEPGRWTAESLRERLKEDLAAFKIPRYVSFVDELPRTATGKVRKDVLRAASRPEENL